MRHSAFGSYEHCPQLICKNLTQVLTVTFIMSQLLVGHVSVLALTRMKAVWIWEMFYRLDFQ